jgi:hypothetical protein
MKCYRHKDIPELEAQIDHNFHQDYRDDNYTLLHNRRVILTNVKDKDIEDNPFWILELDTGR